MPKAKCRMHYVIVAATSAMVSASSTRSFRSNRRAMQALWIFIFRPPTPSAPNVLVPPSLHAVVVDLDAFDAERRNGIEIGSDAQSGAPGPCIARHEHERRRGRR